MSKELIETGVFLTEGELIEIRMCRFDPMAPKYGPRKKLEPWEVLQEIAKRKGLPPLKDGYGLTKDAQIVYRDSAKDEEAGPVTAP